jgi:hypothetical protein
MAGKKDPRDDRPNAKNRAHDAACLPARPFTALISNNRARVQVGAFEVDSSKLLQLRHSRVAALLP